MKIHLLSGFLGSGKTTAIRSASRLLEQRGVRTAVITNDQGIKLVDADLFKQMGLPERAVTNGCFCCNYKELDRGIESLAATENPEIIFAESVGSCTDIIATVLKPLRSYKPGVPVTLSVFADAMLLHMLLVERAALFDEAVNYIYFKQLEEADLLILNKVDLLKPEQLAELKKHMDREYGSKELLYQNALDPESAGRWLEKLDQAPARSMPASLQIDYALYGAGEARLAWLDQEMEIESPAMDANRGAVRLMEDIYHRISTNRYPIGHLKFLLNGKDKISFTSGTSQQAMPRVSRAPLASLLLNARVQTEPEKLAQLVKDSIRLLEEEPGMQVHIKSVSAFQPGFPRPTHRMV